MDQVKPLNYALLCAAAISALTFARPASAQTDTQIQSIEQQIRKLQSQLGEVKADLAARDRALKLAQRQAQDAQAQAAVAQAQAAQAAATVPVAAATAAPAPPYQAPLKQGQFRVGALTVTLGGFAALEGVDRSRNMAASVDTSFNSIPFASSPNYRVPEFRETAQASRFSLMTEGNLDDHQKLTAYLETDFLSAGSSSNSNQSNSYTLRMQQFWGAYDNTNWGLHVLAGQGYSLATPYRVGLVPRQEALPLTIDKQFVVGFNWARQPELRVAKDFDNHTLWAGLSLEEPQTLFSSSAGPNCTTGAAAPAYANGAVPESTSCGGSSVNPTAAYSNTNAPDIIAKLAVDRGWGHFELWGLLRFLDANQAFTGATNGYRAQVTTGEGIGASAVLPLIPAKLEFQVSGLFGKGVGRYGTSQLPDATVNPDGKIEPLTEYSAMGGFVAHATPALDLYVYAGAEGADRKSYGGTYGYGAADENFAGCYAALGTCSAVTSHLVEGTVGAWWRLIASAYGTAQLGAQYEDVERIAFQGIGSSAATKLTPSTNEHIFLFSVRYLPFQ